MEKEIHEFIDLETGEILYVEMTQEQFLEWLAAQGFNDLEEEA